MHSWWRQGLEDSVRKWKPIDNHYNALASPLVHIDPAVW
jgi:hypothetical protein